MAAFDMITPIGPGPGGTRSEKHPRVKQWVGPLARPLTRKEGTACQDQEVFIELHREGIPVLIHPLPWPTAHRRSLVS